MTKDEVFTVLRETVLDVEPELDPDLIRPDRAMAELGLSSLDRMDVVVAALDELGLPPRSEIVDGVTNLGELAEALSAALSTAQPQ